MARSLQPGIDRIYELHRRWLAEVLPNGDSLLTPGKPVWTIENLQELEEHFIDLPHLAKDKSFMQKLHDQMGPVQPAGVQLMAELHVVHFLIIFIGAISAATKVSQIEAVLSWMPEPAPLPDEVKAAMGPGLVHPGQWVLTRRDIQLSWLIRFALAFKTDREPERLVNDPWRLKAFCEPLRDTATEGSRLALLHLAHPDTFEAIVSVGHRQLIIERFGHLAAPSDDDDRTLLAIRAALRGEYGEHFHWYDDALILRWLNSGKPWKTFLGWVQRFREMPEFEAEERTYKLPIAHELSRARELLLAGDGGWTEALKAGVSHKDNNLALWRTTTGFMKWMEDDRTSAATALRELWSEKGPPEARVDAWVALVPPPVLGALGQRLNLTSFLLMGADPTAFPPLTVTVMRRSWELAGWGRDEKGDSAGRVYARWLLFLDELVWASRNWAMPLRDRLDAQSAAWAVVQFTEKPPSWPEDSWAKLLEYRNEGVSKQENDPHAALGEPTDEVLADDAAVGVDHIAEAAVDLHVERDVLDEIVALLEDKRQVVLYGPPGTGKTFLALRLAQAIAQGDESRVSRVQFHPATSYEDFIEGLRPRVTEAGQVTYERTPGPLIKIAEAAAADPARTYVLLVDEINRANLPKVFGELLFLLEYRDEAVRTLYRPEEPFSLPRNLWFIGTMNTADRSVALVDAAMRRRFHFVPFFPHDGPMKGLLRRWLADGGGRLGVAELLDAVNGELREVVGEHLLIGPSHFMKTDLSNEALRRIWTYNVFPLIEEQLWGDVPSIERWRWEEVQRRHASALSGQADTEAGEQDEANGDEPPQP